VILDLSGLDLGNTHVGAY